MAPQDLCDLCTSVADVPGRQHLRFASRGQLRESVFGWIAVDRQQIETSGL